VRVQLTGARPALAIASAAPVAFAAFAALVTLARPAHAQVAELETAHAVFYEAPTRTHMLVYSPSADLQVSPWPWLDVRGGWEADVVSGASVKTKAGPAYGAIHSPDVVTTASVRDVRNLARGELTARWDPASLTAGYAYGTEHDYRSNSLHVGARTDAFQHNTQFELSYARNFDSVCDRVQSPNAAGPTQWAPLESSTGCFTSAVGRTTRAIAIDAYEVSWAQSWTPVIATQLTYTAEIVDGFQSDPYRGVILGEGAIAQEHQPNERAREAVTARIAWFVRPLKAALRVALRGYHDTWAIGSGSVEVEAEKAFGDVRLLVRGRFYRQSGAVFWSDDYTAGNPPLGPRGQYWTGDRELSPFTSWLAGLRVVWTLAPANRRLLGFVQTLKLAASENLTSASYDEYTLAGVPVSDARSYVGTLSLDAAF
jgi:Protein of unknown function (DUF3570)